MRLRVLSVIPLTATLLSGCIAVVPGHLYPIQGPAAAQNPPPIYSASVSSPLQGNDGELGGGTPAMMTLTVTLANNDSCTGSWGPVAPGDNTAGQLSVQWDQVYGPGFFVANVLGNGHFNRGNLTCKSGGTLNIEFFTPNKLHSGSSKGVAQDSKGNLYKVTF